MSTPLAKASPSLEAYTQQIEDMLPSLGLLEDTARQALKHLRQEQDLDTALTSLHILERCFDLSIIEQTQNPDALAAITHEDYPLWRDYANFPGTDEQCSKLSELLYQGDSEKREPVFLKISDYTRPVALKVIARLMNTKTDFIIGFHDLAFRRFVIAHATKETATALGHYLTKQRIDSGRLITLVANNTSKPLPKSRSSKSVRKAFRKSLDTRGDAEKFYTLTYLPTPEDAKLDNIPYDDYVDLFMRMCTADWDAVSKAHEALIETFNAGKELWITNNDGTDVRMNIDGFTFANSLVAKNIPGSEIFSAPHRNSVEGTIVAKGRFMPRTADKIIEDITLRFENGEIVEATAAKGQETLDSILNTDDGARHIGELGIGTNPILRQHVANGLLVEKISGSFHLALGAAYEYTEYEGVPVKLDNGNRSAIHWDITTMLFGKEGRMVLDGQTVMEHGFFTDPRVAILNGTKET